MFFHAPLAAQSEEDAVRAVLVTYAERMQAKDLDGMDSLFAPGTGVHIIEGAGVNHGWADYREYHLAPELIDAEGFEIRYFAVEPQVRGDVCQRTLRSGRRSAVRGSEPEPIR